MNTLTLDGVVQAAPVDPTFQGQTTRENKNISFPCSADREQEWRSIMPGRCPPGLIKATTLFSIHQAYQVFCIANAWELQNPTDRSGPPSYRTSNV